MNVLSREVDEMSARYTDEGGVHPVLHPLPSFRPQGADINARGEWKVLPAPLEHINLHVRGGYILPLQEPALNTNLR